MTSSVGSAVRSWLLASNTPLAKHYDVGLIDLDGVVYVGPQPVAGAHEALAAAVAVGMRLAFVTNNASRTPEAVAAHLRDLGIPAGADDIVTSAQAAGAAARERVGAGARVLVIGDVGLRVAADEAGLVRVESADDAPSAVLQGFSPSLTYGDLAEACAAIHHGALWIACNTDRTLPSERGMLPGNGTLVDAVAAATGAVPLVVGKPERPLHAEAVRRTGANSPLVVGDRLNTDIEGAVNAGAPSLLVLTGVTTVAELLAAGPGQRPTYLADDLGGLLAPHPEVTIGGGGRPTVTCGGWRMGVSDAGRTEMSGDGAQLDAVRAGAALAWLVADDVERKPSLDLDDLARRLQRA